MRRIHTVALATLAMLGAASAANANYVLGSFEDSGPDGFGAWSSSNTVVPFDGTGAPAASYTYGPTGATSGSVALDVNNGQSYGQTLAYDFVANNNVAQFLANDVISFDVTAPPAGTATAGYWQLYEVDLNSQGGGYHDIAATTPAQNQYYYSGFNGTTFHLSFNYDAYKATIASNPSYLDMIIATNAGGGAPSDFYFDNIQLSAIPEPTTFSLLGLGAASLLGRRRRR